MFCRMLWQTELYAYGFALPNLIIGLDVFAKEMHDRIGLWLASKTTLLSLGLYRDVDHARF